MNIFLTGGAGYVGSHMVKHLVLRGHAVTVFDNLSRGHRDAVLAGEFMHGDLLDAIRLRDVLRPGRFDVVMHFAALCYVGESVAEPRAYYRNNVVGTLNLLDAMLDAGIGNLVFSSTCATYGNPLELPIREDHIQRPINPYGSSKMMVELMLKDYARACALNSISLRYFNAAGCDPEGELGERHDPETHLIPLILREALRVRAGGDPVQTSLVIYGDDYDTPDGTCIRDYVHVEDLAAAHLSAATHLVNGKARGAAAYNLGTERGFSVIEIIDSCRTVTGIPIQYKIGTRRSGDPSRLVANADAARAGLGWQPRLTDIDTIIETAWRWMEASAKPRALDLI